MDFRLTDEQLQVEEMVRDLSRKEFAPRAAQVDEESRYPGENHRRLAELGLLGMLYPDSFGGRTRAPSPTPSPCGKSRGDAPRRESGWPSPT